MATSGKAGATEVEQNGLSGCSGPSTKHHGGRASLLLLRLRVEVEHVDVPDIKSVPAALLQRGLVDRQHHRHLRATVSVDVATTVRPKLGLQLDASGGLGQLLHLGRGGDVQSSTHRGACTEKKEKVSGKMGEEGGSGSGQSRPQGGGAGSGGREGPGGRRAV